MKQNIELRQVRDFGQLINDTFVFVRQNLKPLLKAFAAICGVFVVGMIITGMLQQIQLSEMMHSAEYPNSPYRALGLEYYLHICFSIVTYIAITITTLSYISLYREKGNHPPALDEVWGYFKYFFMRILGSGIVLFLLCILGFVFCIVPGVYLWPIVSVIIAIMVFENGTLGYAFDRGFKLVKNHWWTIFGAMFIIYIVVYIASMFFILPQMLISTGGLFFSTAKVASTPLIIITTVLSSLAQVFMILPCVVTALSYFSLVEIKEGTGLLDKVNMIGKNPSMNNLPEEEY